MTSYGGEDCVDVGWGFGFGDGVVHCLDGRD